MTDFRPPEPSFFVRLIATGFFSGYSVFCPGNSRIRRGIGDLLSVATTELVSWGGLLIGLFFVGVIHLGHAKKPGVKIPNMW